MNTDNRPKGISQLCERSLNKLFRLDPWDIPVPNGLSRQHDIKISLARLSSRRTDADVRHIPDQHDRLPSGLCQDLGEVRTCERTGMLLVHYLLRPLGLELVKFGSEVGARGKNGCAIRGGV